MTGDHFLGHWTRRRIPWPAGTTFSPLPVCPECLHMVAPEDWDAHRDGHQIPDDVAADPEPTEEEMNRAWAAAQIPPLPHPEQLMPTPLPAGTLPPGLVLPALDMTATLWVVTGWHLVGDQLRPRCTTYDTTFVDLEAVQRAVAQVRTDPTLAAELPGMLWSVDRAHPRSAPEDTP